MQKDVLFGIFGKRTDLDGLSTLEKEEVLPFIDTMADLDKAFAEFDATGFIDEEDAMEIENSFAALMDAIENNYLERLKNAQKVILNIDLNPEMSDERRAEVLKSLDDDYTAKIDLIAEKEEEINTILDKVSTEKRQATAEEVAEIMKIRKDASLIAIASLTTNGEDQITILNRYQEEGLKVKREEFSKILKEQIDYRDASKAEAQAAHDEERGF